jgi:hypothetical protein
LKGLETEMGFGAKPIESRIGEGTLEGEESAEEKKVSADTE